MTDKQIIIDEFRYTDGTNEQENYESFINSFDDDDEVYYRGKHYIKVMKEQLKAKEQECERLKETIQLQNKMQMEVCEEKNAEIERLKEKLKKIKEYRHNYCMNCEDLLKPSHSCKGCNMVTLKRVIEDEENE